MMHTKSNTILCLNLMFLSLLVCVKGTSQGMGAADNPAYKVYFDSLKQMEYPYTFPLLGKKAYRRGYDLQYAWGISPVYFTQRQEIDITSIRIGINGSDMVDLSEFIVFGPTIASTNAYTVRPDLWVLPFLDVYGIFGFGTTETQVNLQEPIGFATEQRFEATSFGVGATLAGAIGPLWIAWDNNINFANIDVLVEPVPAFNSSFRLGHTLRAPYDPQRSLSVWGGVFYQSIQNDTEGSIALTDIFPSFGSGAIIEYLNSWAETLPPGQKFIADQIISKLEDISNGIDPGDAVIDYVLDKRVAGPVNLIFGAQYQLSKKWIFRTELGVFGKRSQFLLNVNYRFEGFGK